MTYKDYVTAKETVVAWETHSKAIREHRKTLKRNQPYSKLSRLDIIWGHRMDLSDLINSVNKYKLFNTRNIDVYDSLIIDAKKRLLEERLLYKITKDGKRSPIR